MSDGWAVCERECAQLRHDKELLQREIKERDEVIHIYKQDYAILSDQIDAARAAAELVAKERDQAQAATRWLLREWVDPEQKDMAIEDTFVHVDGDLSWMADSLT